ncbi:MAG: amino acid ABC transporter substrate-binding protein [Streptosporangiaceae bacterium]
MRLTAARFSAGRLAAGAIAVAAALMAGCGSTSAQTAATTAASPIVVGVSLPLTGAFASDGQAFKRGYELWQSDVNADGGLLGRPVRLKILNDNSSQAKTAAEYRQLITADHVDLTFGPFSTLLTVPAEEAVAPHGYAMIEGAGTANLVYYNQDNLKYHNLFSPSLPVADYMKPFVDWIKSLPASERPKTAAYPSANDPFATPAVSTAQAELQKLGVHTVYADVFPEVVKDYEAPATAVAKSGADIVVLGSTDVPTVATFMSVFEKQHYVPKVFIAVSGPDQGQAFLGTVGQAPADGMMVPDGWFGLYPNAVSYAMVESYISRYGGTAASINADVAEAYSVGQVAAAAIGKTRSVSNAAIIRYLRSGATLQTVQGPVRFNAVGQNPSAAAFVFQWNGSNFSRVLPPGPGSSAVVFPKPPWTG